MRILFYAVNGLGMGHVTRLLAIAGQIRKLDPDSQILFLTTSESNAIYQEGFLSVKLPSKQVKKKSFFSGPLHISILHQTSWSVISSFRPDTVVVDTFPFGFSGELAQVFRWDEYKFVFIYRERKKSKTKDPFFQEGLKNYDLILIPHKKDEVEFVLPKDIEHFYIGNICIRDKKELLPSHLVKEHFNLPQDKKCVLVTLGGGGQVDLNNILSKIVDQFKDIKEIYPVIAQGPLLRHFKSNGNCSVINGYYPFCELYHAFDFVIAGCGYNTVNELLYLNKPAIYIPFERTIDDQYKRAQRIHQSGLGLKADLDNISTIRKHVLHLLDDHQYNKIKTNLKNKRYKNNAIMAAKLILRITGRK